MPCMSMLTIWPENMRCLGPEAGTPPPRKRAEHASSGKCITHGGGSPSSWHSLHAVFWNPCRREGTYYVRKKPCHGQAACIWAFDTLQRGNALHISPWILRRHRSRSRWCRSSSMAVLSGAMKKIRHQRPTQQRNERTSLPSAKPCLCTDVTRSSLSAFHPPKPQRTKTNLSSHAVERFAHQLKSSVYLMLLVSAAATLSGDAPTNTCSSHDRFDVRHDRFDGFLIHWCRTVDRGGLHLLL